MSGIIVSEDTSKVSWMVTVLVPNHAFYKSPVLKFACVVL